MEFCPTCGMLLRYEYPDMGRSARFYCPSCPYVCSIDSRVKIKRKQRLVKKEVEPVFTLEDMMKGGSETEATCPHCNFGRARYQQLQIRSADEPATTFYYCLNEKCSRMWRED
uniref:DNA-directed RNA polymerase subunit n=1 Tax=Rhizophora mucronata TaxID=61149 RepID=A0A2P2J5K0_RHIMU